MQISRRALKPHALAFEKYSEKLIKCLPMDDTSFTSKLSAHRILPGATNSQLEALPTQATKALYFLDHVIKPVLDIDDTSSFNNLLSVMEHCGYAHVERLSCKIKSEIDKANDIEPGMSLSQQYAYLQCMCNEREVAVV